MRRDSSIHIDHAAQLALIFVLSVLLAVAALLAVSWGASLKTKRVEGLRINQVVLAAVAREKDKVAKFAANYENWGDDLLEEGTQRNSQDRSFISVNSDGNFSGMWVLDKSGRRVLTVSPKGQVSQHTHLHSDNAQQLIGRLGTSGGAVTEVFEHHGSLSILVIVQVDKTSEFTGLIGSRGEGYLLVQKSLNEDLLADIKETMQLESLALVRPEDGSGKVGIEDANGKIVAKITWSVPEVSSFIVNREFYYALGISLALVGVGFGGAYRVATSFRSLNRQARVDSLSKLPNRNELLRRMRGKRNLDDIAALALIDLDGFKLINDFHGHLTGDAVIRHVAILLRTNAPESSTVARLGGDEFAVFFKQGGQNAVENLNKILEKLSQPTTIDQCAIKIGASIGVTMIGQTLLSTEALRQADIAMYAAKKRGKMQVVAYDESMEAPLKEMIAVKDELHKAIDERQITVKYQPIICAKTGVIETLEALARWTSPTRGNVPADLFISVSEEFGLIGRLGELILENVLADLAKLPATRIALNVSTAQITNFQFTELLVAKIESGAIAGDLFNIEITETHLVENPEIIHEVMLRLSKLGIRFVLDDFGTGYASIGFLRRFPFNAVKVDRAIIEDCLVSSQARSVLASIVAMAHAFDMNVVAEGIETEKHASIARAAGCDQLQGWYFSRAVSAGDDALWKLPSAFAAAA